MKQKRPADDLYLLYEGFSQPVLGMLIGNCVGERYSGCYTVILKLLRLKLFGIVHPKSFDRVFGKMGSKAYQGS